MNRKMDIEKVKRITVMLEEGKSFTEIAKNLEVSKRTIEYWVRRLKFAGVTLNITRGPKPLNLNVIESKTTQDTGRDRSD